MLSTAGGEKNRNVFSDIRPSMHQFTHMRTHVVRVDFQWPWTASGGPGAPPVALEHLRWPWTASGGLMPLRCQCRTNPVSYTHLTLPTKA